MGDNEIRKKILELLYQEYKRTPGYGHGSLPDIAQEIGVDYEKVDFNAEYLSDNYFVKLGMGRTIEITPKGVNFVEGPHEFNPFADYRNQLIQISGGNVTGIVQAHSITINPPDFFESISREIRNQSDLDPKKKKSWLRSLSEMAEHPMILEICRKIFESIRF